MAWPFLKFLKREDSGRTHVRRFDAAAGGRRGFGIGTIGRTGTETALAAPVIRSRARYRAANDAWIGNAVVNMVGAMVGSGIVPTPQHPCAEIRAELAALFDTWAETADADERTGFWGLQAEIARCLVVGGESFVQIIDTAEGPRLRLIPAELIDESRTAELSDGRFIISGVKFNADGTRAAYYVLPARPTDVCATTGVPVRVDADQIIHVFKPLGPGQVRGISWLAPVILPANELDQLTDALVMGAKVAAMFAGFITNQNAVGGEDPFDGEAQPGLEPGTLVRLNGGWDIKFATPGQVSEVAPLLKHGLRQLAAGLGYPNICFPVI